MSYTTDVILIEEYCTVYTSAVPMISQTTDLGDQRQFVC